VSHIKTSRSAGGMAAIGARAKDRAKDAAAQAAPLGKRAKDRAKDAAVQAVPMGKRAGTTAAEGVRQGVLSARGWAAPRLEDAADAVTASVAPKVSSALRSTARQVRPASAAGRTGLRRLLNWRWLLGVGAVVAAAGATAAVAMRRRYAAATAEAEDATEPADAESAQAPEAASDAAARSDVNGQVSTPRR
jgi:hypothetical protein